METFKENGSYNKTDWKIGDIITSERLNKIEDALYEINENSNDVNKLDLSNYVTKSEMPTNVSDFINDAGYVTRSHTHNNYATKTYVDDAIAGVDLNNYALRTEIPTNVSAFNNDAGYITQNHTHSNYTTKTELNEAIADIDLSNYATKSEIPTKVSAFNNDTGYVTGSHTHSNYVLKSEIPTVPTKTSQLINDSGYITNVNMPTVPTRTSQLTNDSGYINNIPSEYVIEAELLAKNYANKDYVTNAINNAQLGGVDGSNIDLSIYVTRDDLANKADIADIPTKTSQLSNDSNFLTDIPLEYVTETELLAKNYADVTYVTNAVNNAQINVDLSNYATKNDLTSKADVSHAHDNYAPKADIPTKVSQLSNDMKYVVGSSDITRIEIVTIYPPEEEQETGVLYIRVSDL